MRYRHTKVVVTGAEDFIGSRLTELLVQEGQCRRIGARLAKGAMRLDAGFMT